MSELNDISLAEQKVEIVIGGKTRTLIYDMFAFSELEKEFGDLNGVQEAMSLKSIKNILTLIKAGISHEDENITIKELGRGLSLKNLPEISEKIITAIQNSLPQVEESSESVGESQEVPAVS